MFNLVKKVTPKLIFISLFLATSCMPEEDYVEIVYQTEIIEVEVEKEIYVYVEVPVAVEAEEPTVEELRDIYYNGEFDGADYYNYFEIFMWEAQNYGIDLDYVREGEVIIEPRSHANKNWAAWAKERDNDEKVHIGIEPDLFFESTRTNRGRLFIMFHEFGHDIFNLEHDHIADCAEFNSIMNSCAKNDINPEIFKTLAHEFFKSMQ